MKKQLKLAIFALTVFIAGVANAQITTETDAGLNKDTGRKAGGTADDEKSIRLIDNKGTIKYLQAKNGLTQITSTSPGNRTTTTWQLGGSLNNNTYIDVDGNAFALDGLELVTDVSTASTNTATDLNESDHGGTTTGFTVLIRDEATGKTQKIRVSDLIQVQGSQHIYAAAEIVDTASPSTLVLSSLPGAPQNLVYQKVSVYRNGAKLLAGIDYIVVNGATATDSAAITLQPQGTDPEDWEVFAGDKIEVHWIK